MNPVPPGPSSGERSAEQQDKADAAGSTMICAKCGEEAEPVHLGCRLCLECCDCRPAGT